jgi:hypothetical protein
MRAVTVDGADIMASNIAPYGTTRQVVGDAKGGDEVIFQVVDGNLVYAGLAHPYWISRLKLKSETAASTNTSQLLQELERPSRAWGLPALPPESRTFTEVTPEPAPAPAAAPIRGLW